MRWLTGWLRGGGDELGWDDLVRRVVDAVARLARYRNRGRKALPPDVVVSIEVGEDAVALVREFVEDPAFDQDVVAALANECDASPDELPTREYEVLPTEGKTTVSAREGPPRVWAVAIEGGDRAGEQIVLAPGREEWRFGRGEMHGAGAANDLVVCHATEYVSRRAGRFVAEGRELLVEAFDQGDALSLRRTGGEVVRPSRTARGRARVRPGDVIELSDGGGRAVQLTVERVVAKEGEGDGGRHA